MFHGPTPQTQINLGHSPKPPNLFSDDVVVNEVRRTKDKRMDTNRKDGGLLLGVLSKSQLTFRCTEHRLETAFQLQYLSTFLFGWGKETDISRSDE